MEASSPLAAMQPINLMSTWGGSNIYNNAHVSRVQTCGQANAFSPGSFNFRDISMKRSTPDYFALNPVRGSSPTASLAADLSQNFHIDMSPQLPTPRRALFTTSLFATMDGRENVTTPPLPSSSPGRNERMDISPLPHKAPFFVQNVQSPSPGVTPNEDDIMDSSPPRPDMMAAPAQFERKKSVLLRPSLSRSKGYSTSSMPSFIEPGLPFPFGAGSDRPSRLSTSTSMTLGECFLESPPQERRPKSAHSPSSNMLAPPRLKQPFGSLNGNSVRNGSPIGAHQRRPSNPFMRPRKLCRRSLSMFENPADIVNANKEEAQASSEALQSIMDVDEQPHQPILPHFYQEGQPDSIPRIDRSTLLEVLDGKYNDHYDQRMVIDCRFEYEFDGGHIDGAVNYNDKELLTSQLFETALPGKTLLIFHCEYSAHRAPIMARFVRKQDRTTNAEHYPRLSYPEVYILDGGYSKFFQEHQARCFPQSYVEMGAAEHQMTCEREMGKLRQNRSKLCRAQTYAFGQQEDSPTAPNRAKVSNVLMYDGSPGIDRAPTRRMASY